jgi:hypothetical protein
MTPQERRTYITWYWMIHRCTNPKSPRYEDYGRRGIKVCEKWLTLEGFIEDMGLRPEGLTLERINNDGPYELLNCKWATPAEQARNRCDNVNITFDGRTMCLEDWARTLDIPRQTIHSRIERGLPVEEVLFQGRLKGHRS